MSHLIVDLSDFSGSGPCVICRRLVADGADHDTLVEFVRAGRPVFRPTRVGWWADRTVEESTYRSIGLVRYHPFPSRLKGD